MYTGRKQNTLPFDEKCLTDKLQHKKNLEANKPTLFFFFCIQNEWKQVWFYPGKNLGFWSFVRDDWSKVLEVLHSF